MRSYCGIYVDVGYFMSAASTRVTGTSYRGATQVDVAGLLAAVATQVTAHADLPLLRTHWYDAASKGAANAEQRQIATLPRLKLRLGRTSVHGEQKGVDLKLALDLIRQAQNRVTDVVYLLSGDDDLTEAVEEAQHLGTQIVLLAVPDADGRPISVSRNLQMACDDLLLLDGAALDTYVQRPAPVTSAPDETAAAAPPARVTPADLAALAEARAPAAAPPSRLVTKALPVYTSSTGKPSAGAAALSAATEDAIASVVGSLLTSWWLNNSEQSRSELLRARPQIPQEMDRTLLLDLSRLLHIDELDEPIRYRLREAFWERVERL